MAQVRDLTPLRDADGRLVALPAVEDALAACLDAIRNVQAQRPQNKRFDTNRIIDLRLAADRADRRGAERARPADPADHGRRRAGGGPVPRPGQRDRGPAS